jgi:hypothetical protein
VTGQVQGELASFQAGLVNIDKLFSLNLGLKSSTDKKLDKIFSMLKGQEIEKSDRFYELIDHIIDSCLCEEYTHTRLFPLERIVRKITHPTLGNVSRSSNLLPS